MNELKASNYKTLTFDCYGTLIDWEAGILGFLQPLLEKHDVHVLDSWVLEFFAEAEPAVQAEGGSYRVVLGKVLDRFAERLAFTTDDAVRSEFAESMASWPPYEDTVAALQQLADRFALSIISNVDDDLFAYSAKQLGVEFADVTTAGQIGVYKPAAAMFEAALEKAQGPVLHVAQSRFHDIVPATALGLDTVWIERPGAHAAQPTEAQPTWTFQTLGEFAAAIC